MTLFFVWKACIVHTTSGTTCASNLQCRCFLCLQMDGYIARNCPNQASALGSILDPLADKLLVSILTISLATVNLIPCNSEDVCVKITNCWTLAVLFYCCASVYVVCLLCQFCDLFLLFFILFENSCPNGFRIFALPLKS